MIDLVDNLIDANTPVSKVFSPYNKNSNNGSPKRTNSNNETFSLKVKRTLEEEKQ